ncbi:hypothetical protein ACOME3_002073 [Neoechinorhynchus agilis]
MFSRSAKCLVIARMALIAYWTIRSALLIVLLVQPNLVTNDLKQAFGNPDIHILVIVELIASIILCVCELLLVCISFVQKSDDHPQKGIRWKVSIFTVQIGFSAVFAVISMFFLYNTFIKQYNADNATLVAKCILCADLLMLPLTFIIAIFFLVTLAYVIYRKKTSKEETACETEIQSIPE